ncbi:MAG: hypothetical protein WAT70_08730 [Rhizobiaceae bacterium]
MGTVDGQYALILFLVSAAVAAPVVLLVLEKRLDVSIRPATGIVITVLGLYLAVFAHVLMFGPDALSDLDSPAVWMQYLIVWIAGTAISVGLVKGWFWLAE